VAKSPKPAAGASRRDRLASFEAARKAEQRRRSLGLFVICGVLALALLAYPVYLFVNDQRARSSTITEFGADLAAAGCSDPQQNAATGNQQHVAVGTPVTYDRVPPDSGPHYATPAPFTKHFYAAADRPEVETLVHNLEHGYTIAWYRPDAPSDQITALQNIAKTFGDNYSLADKFIAAPWTDPGLPDGKNVVLTHWYADPSAPTDASKQKGIRQECGAVSGAAIDAFMKKYPATDSPEPNAG
jgi:hypothetical protein